MTTSVCGVSRSGCVYFGEAAIATGALAVTSTDSASAANSRTAAVDVMRNRTPVPASITCNACSAVKAPETPAD